MPSSRDNEFGGLPPAPLLCSEAELDSREVLYGIILAQYTIDLAEEWQGSYRFTPEMCAGVTKSRWTVSMPVLVNTHTMRDRR